MEMTGFLKTGLTIGVFPKNDYALFSEDFFLKTGYQQDAMCDVTVGSVRWKKLGMALKSGLNDRTKITLSSALIKTR